MTAFLQNCLNGISIGSIYALIAIGYTMVYGILRLINFAPNHKSLIHYFSNLAPQLPTLS